MGIVKTFQSAPNPKSRPWTSSFWLALLVIKNCSSGSFNQRLSIYHLSIIYGLLSSMIIYLSSIIIYYHRLSSIIIYYHLLSYITVSYIIIYYHLSSSSIYHLSIIYLSSIYLWSSPSCDIWGSSIIIYPGEWDVHFWKKHLETLWDFDVDTPDSQVTSQKTRHQLGCTIIYPHFFMKKRSQVAETRKLNHRKSPVVRWLYNIKG